MLKFEISNFQFEIFLDPRPYNATVTFSAHYFNCKLQAQFTRTFQPFRSSISSTHGILFILYHYTYIEAIV